MGGLFHNITSKEGRKRANPILISGDNKNKSEYVVITN